MFNEMSRMIFSVMNREVIKKTIIISICYVFSLMVFFRYQILNHFNLVFSDTYDGFIEISILEHWNNVFSGASAWSSVNYFYPDKMAIGYNDGYFLYGIIYSIYRKFGLDPIVSSELVNFSTRSVGFFLFYVACRKILNVEWGWSVLGAVIFTLCNSVYLHMVHQQLASVSFVPGMAILVNVMICEFYNKRRFLFFCWGGIFVVFYAAWLMTAFYMAWFLFFFTSLFVLLWLGTSSFARWREVGVSVRRQALPLSAIAVLSVVVNIPFLLVYLPKANQTGMHEYKTVMEFSPSLFDVINVGRGNVFYGKVMGLFYEHFREGRAEFNERTTGVALIILATFFISFVFSIKHPRDSGKKLILMYIVTVATWISTLHVGKYSLYFVVFDFFPGAKALRAIGRYQIFLMVPVIGLSVQFLSRHAKRMPRWLALMLPFFLVGEQINTDPILRINRPVEMARLSSLSVPPKRCEAFYASEDDPKEGYLSPRLDGIYRHSVVAMLIAEIYKIPTVNGYATFIPPNYDLFFPAQADYRDRLRAYVESRGIHGPVCGLDLRLMEWMPEASDVSASSAQ